MAEHPNPEHHDVAFRLNGAPVCATVDARLHLADLLRTTFRLTGTHIGCEHGVCGACNVLIDGRSVRSCLTLAVQADGAEVETIEGLTARNAIAQLQREFVDRNALQCGYCTPGMLVTAAELLTRGAPTRADIRDALSGNYCRCTGYQAIVDAIEAVATRRAETAR
jgi:aerobic carbon-monoxide dehydrogenase small subunit